MLCCALRIPVGRLKAGADSEMRAGMGGAVCGLPGLGAGASGAGEQPLGPIRQCRCPSAAAGCSAARWRLQALGMQETRSQRRSSLRALALLKAEVGPALPPPQGNGSPDGANRSPCRTWGRCGQLRAHHSQLGKCRVVAAAFRCWPCLFFVSLLGRSRGESLVGKCLLSLL